MAQEWREVSERRTRTSKTRQLHIDGQPTNIYMFDGIAMPVISGASPGETIDKQVVASADDGMTGGSYGSDGFNTNGNSVDVGNYDRIVANGWYRFTGISGLASATIDVAYIQLYKYTGGDSPLTKIYAEDAESPSAPTSKADYDSKPMTSHAVDWDGALSAGWNNSPSIVDVIQELATDYDPTAIQILHKDDGSPSVKYGVHLIESYAWDYSDHTYGPKLHIEYTAGGGPAGVKTLNDLAIASVKTINDTAIASVKTINDAA